MEENFSKPEIFNLIKKYYGILLCMLIFIFLAINLLYWLSVDKLPIGWDQAVHFIDSIRFYKTLTGRIEGLPGLLSIDNYYPPLITFITVPFYALFNISPDVGIAGLNLTSLAILIFSIYGIGKIIKDKSAGVLSAFIVSIYPAISVLSTLFMIDLPLVAMVSLSMYALLLTDYFKNKKYSIFFGITLGLGLLTKWTFIIFVVGPLLYILYKSFKQAQLEQYMNNVKNISISFITGAVISSIWYLPNLYIFLELFKHGNIDTGQPQYTTILVYSLSLIFIILFIVMFIYLIMIEKLNSYYIMLIIWIVIPLVIFSLQYNRDMRFVAPIFPAFALITGIGVSAVKNKKIKLALASVIVIFGILIFLSTFYIPYDLKVSDNLILRSYAYLGTNRIDLLSQLKVFPNQGDWKEEEIFNTIVNDSNKSPISVCVIPDNPYINGPIGYISCIKNVDIQYYSGGYDPYSIFYSDYILTLKERKGYWGPDDSRHIYEKSIYAQDLLEQHIYDFVLIKQISLPDGSDLLIYRNTYNKSSEHPPEHIIQVNFSNKIQLVGYDIKELDTNKSKENELFGRVINVYEINYYWKALQNIDKNYTISVHFLDKNGMIKLQQDHQPFGGIYPTSEWKVGEILKEKCIVRIPWYIDSGIYDIGVGLYIPNDEVLLPDRLYDENNIARVIIGNLTFVNQLPENYANWPDYLKL